MNIKDNQKYRESEFKIREAFFKIIDENEREEVEVSKICKVANIHRTTFYGHYSDIYDLTNTLAKEYIIDKSEELITHNDGFLELLQYIKDNQHFFRYYYLSGLSRMEKDLMSDNLLASIKAYNIKIGSKNSIEDYYNEAFYRDGISAIIKRWLYRRCTDDPKVISSIILSNIKRIKGENK